MRGLRNQFLFLHEFESRDSVLTDDIVALIGDAYGPTALRSPKFKNGSGDRGMRFKQFGRTGVRVSELCLGTMSFGGEADEEESSRMFNRCRDIGINFFDCADGYSKGKAETILGARIRGSRDELVITSKCFIPTADDVNARGGNRRHILRAVEASLGRLGTDRLDVLFMHRWDPVVPLEETLRALEKLVSDGKVLYLGASNYAAWQIAKGLGISEKNGWPRFDAIQPMYSLVKRQAEAEIFPLALAEDLGVITYSTVGGGLLSGKYGKDKRPDAGRIVTNQEYAKCYGDDWVIDVAEKFTAFAKKQGVHPVSLAVAWAAAHPAVTCPIIGARNLEQLEPSLNAPGVQMTDELHAEIAALSRTPPPATDRREEQL
jgi:aryl-alcohol dehydrogenase-like predicted oxidoreductase